MKRGAAWRRLGTEARGFSRPESVVTTSFFLVLHPAAPDPRRHETRARRGDSRAPGGAGSAGWKAAAPTSFSVVPHPAGAGPAHA